MIPIPHDKTQTNVLSLVTTEITDAQRIAIDELCKGSLPHEAARAAGVTRRALQLWRKKAAFNVELTKAQKQTIVTRNADAPAKTTTTDRPKIKGPIKLETLDAEAMRTILERIQLGDGKVALEFAKARGLLKPPEDTTNETYNVSLGEMPKDEAELEELLREVPPPVNLEPTFKPGVMPN